MKYLTISSVERIKRRGSFVILDVVYIEIYIIIHLKRDFSFT